jgi:uncharacterized membrane protein
MLDAISPIHPRFVHFPIALSLVGVLFLVLGLLRQQEHFTGSQWT